MDVMDYLDLQGRRGTKGNLEDHEVLLDYRVQEGNKVLLASVQGLPGPSSGGAVYTRWGRTVCPATSGTELVYKGRAAGTKYDHTEGGANYLCTTKEPQYLSSTIPKYSANTNFISYLYGAEYQVPGFSSLN